MKKVCLMCVSEDDSSEQKVVLDVMPLTSGYLPFPLVRISKYIPGETSGTGMNLNCIGVPLSCST